jgi:hypothetical protein
MRSALLCLSLVALIACKACGQIEASVTKYQQVFGLNTPIVVGTRVLAEKVDTISTKPVALIYVDAAGEIKVEASDIQRQDVRIAKIDDGMYLLDAPGKTWVEIKEYIEFEVNGVKRKFLSDSKTLVVELGKPDPGPGPGPGPGPTPPEPTSCDAKANSNFEFLAKRSCQWVDQVVIAASRSKRGELSKVYQSASEKLSSGQHLTINAASTAVREDWAKALPTDADKQAWASWSTKANEELAKHWVDQSSNTAKRELMVQFFRSLAEGLQP